jgi:diketogulonate reductase-like aldo/keto reductase
MSSSSSAHDLPTVPRRKLGPDQGLEVSALGLGCMGMSSFYGTPKPEEEMIELIRYAVQCGITLLDTADVYGPHTNEVLIGRVSKQPITATTQEEEAEEGKTKNTFCVSLVLGFFLLECNGGCGFCIWVLHELMMILDKTNKIFFKKKQAIKGIRDKVEIATKFGNVISADGQWGVRADPEWVRESCEGSLKRLQIDCIDLYYLHRLDPTVPIEISVRIQARKLPSS